MQYERKDGVTMENIGSQIMLLSEEGDVAVLNESGKFILEQMNAGKDNAQIEAAMIDKYGITSDTAKRDLNNLLQTLEEKQMIRRIDV